MLEKFDPATMKKTPVAASATAPAAPVVDLHVKRADAMCSRAEVLQSSSELSKEDLLTARKKCLQAKIEIAKAKKASSFIEGPIDMHQKVHENGKATLEQTIAEEEQKKDETINIKKVFYINLDKETQKKNKMEAKLKQSGLTYERFPAATWQEIQKMPKDKDVPQELLQYSSQGNSDYLKWFPENAKQVTHAIYLSHARLLKKISEEDNDSDDVYVVLEDDVTLNKNWKEELTEKAKTLPKDWDVAKFVYWGIKRCEDKVPDSDWYEYRSPSMWTNKVDSMYSGNQAYMFRAKSIKNILQQLRGMPIMDIDGAMISNHQEKTEKVNGVDTPTVWGMHTYVIEWPLGKHNKQHKPGRCRQRYLSYPAQVSTV